jgi:hypothetical protein
MGVEAPEWRFTDGSFSILPGKFIDIDRDPANMMGRGGDLADPKSNAGGASFRRFRFWRPA